MIRIVGSQDIALKWAGSSAERAAESDADLALVRRVQAGDVEAFDVLVRSYRERVYSILYHLTGNREDAADLTQEAFIKAFQSIQRFQGNSSFFTWLYRIAVNGSLTHLRRSRIRKFFSFDQVDSEGAPPELIDALELPAGQERRLVLQEIQQRLNEAFQKLSLDHRTVVTLFEIEGLSHQDIADITSTSVGTVRSRLHYAKQQLQSELQDLLKT
jgi:RNA polymerase sigma-70 factor (ECF subfamily)